MLYYNAPVPETIWIAPARSTAGWVWQVDYGDTTHTTGGIAPTLDDAMRAVSETVQNARGAG